MGPANAAFATYFERERHASGELTRRGRKRTKVIATLGPATDSEDVLRVLYHAGMNVARLNMSHGNHDDHLKRLELARKVSTDTERPIAILADLQGPKIRLRDFTPGVAVRWSTGDEVIITTADLAIGDARRIGTTYDNLHGDVVRGDAILIDDGRLRLRVQEVNDRDVHCLVEIGGPVSNRKGINLPGVKVSAPSMTDKDKEDLDWAIRNGVDYVALSFVRNAQDIRYLKRRIGDCGRNIPVIAKIERPEAVADIESIIAESDGIMVARGDLGIEISTERLPVVQKHLIARANAHGKIVITATQMLESMISAPVPTRAESSDVANAIFDGTDAVMLSAETSVGNYPAEAVGEMMRIAVEAENSPFMQGSGLDISLAGADVTSAAITEAGDVLAHRLNAAAVMCFSHGHDKAQLLSKRRMPRPLVTICYDESTWARLSLVWGTVPLRVEYCTDAHELLERGISEGLRHGIFKSGDLVVVLQGFGPEISASIRIVRV